MASEFEPPLKKAKIFEGDLARTFPEHIDMIKNSKQNLTPIISEHFTNTIPCIEVYTATVKTPKDISKAILRLNEAYPLKQLQHLKRVRKKEILLTTVQGVELKSIDAFVGGELKEFADILEDHKIVNVPAMPPQLKWQFEECNKIWPCNFHPNKYNERLFSGAFFDDKELSMHRKFMAVVFEVLRIKYGDRLSDVAVLDQLDEYGVAVVVDPTVQSIVAVSVDKRNEHPLQHAAMLAIDNVARTQNGGSWVAGGKTSDEIVLRGIEDDLLVELKENCCNVNFGAKSFKSKREGDHDQSGPYLCTGYDVYCLREPCIMCAMALVHARAKRVFFCLENRTDGALKTKAKLQTIASLNHHFEVFTGFL